jgi:isoquinoline 1-oxidoreductase beta subunit
MLHAAPRMSPRLGGAMTGFDPAPALAMAGVERVVDLGSGVAVLARDGWTAMRAAEAVECEWGPAPYPADTGALDEAIRAAFEDEPDSTLRDEGDVASLGAPALEAEYRAPWLAHATLEPMNATVLVSEGAAEIWCGNQSPTLIRDHVADALGLPAGAVTVHTPFLGGGFGRRGEVDFAVVAARVAATVPGTPVKTAWSREEDMTHDFYRPAAHARMRGWVEGGAVAGLHTRLAAPSVTRASARRLVGAAPPGADKGHVEGAFDQPYGLPHWRVDGHVAEVAVPVGFWRSVGNSQNAFFQECFLDELAHAAGRDPLALRVELARARHEPSARVLEAVGEMSGWGPTPEGVGRGVAFCFSFGTPVGEVVELRREGDRVRISDVWIACDVGPCLDPRIVEAQMSGAALFGLSGAVLGEITFEDGMVAERNFPDYDALRMSGAPRAHVRILRNREEMGGAGEPGVPPAAPALANALFDLTGERVRALPLRRRFDFVT